MRSYGPQDSRGAWGLRMLSRYMLNEILSLLGREWRKWGEGESRRKEGRELDDYLVYIRASSIGINHSKVKRVWPRRAEQDMRS